PPACLSRMAHSLLFLRRLLPPALLLRRLWLCLLSRCRRWRLSLSLRMHLLRRRPPLSLRPAWLLSHLRWLRRNHARLGCRLILRRRPALATLLRRLSQRLLLLRVPHRRRPLCFSL